MQQPFPQPAGLPQNEDIYRRIVESAEGFAIFSMDSDGIVQTWNPGAEKLMGWSVEEMTGRDCALIFTPQDLAHGVHDEERRKALAEGRAEDERWHMRKDGGQFWASGLMMRLEDDAGQVRGLLKIIRDRTEAREARAALQRSEERLRLILDSATDYAIFTTDPDGRVTSWNPGAEHLTGHAAAQMIGLPAEILFTGEDRAAGIPGDEFARALDQGRAQNERWHLRADGTRFWASGLTMPLPEGPEGAGFLTILRDATERHRREEHQRILMNEVSHRVKNSLSLVAGLLSLQARSARDETVRHAIRDAETRIATIAQVHDQLWRQADVQAVDLAPFLTSLCARLQETVTDVRVEAEIAPVVLAADRAIQIALVVNELLTNAFKYGWPGRTGGTVRVRLVADARIRLEVRDNGRGLPEGFDPAATRDSLGMKVVSGLVQQLGGVLEARNEDGACFVLHLSADGNPLQDG